MARRRDGAGRRADPGAGSRPGSLQRRRLLKRSAADEPADDASRREWRARDLERENASDQSLLRCRQRTLPPRAGSVNPVSVRWSGARRAFEALREHWRALIGVPVGRFRCSVLVRHDRTRDDEHAREHMDLFGVGQGAAREGQGRRQGGQPCRGDAVPSGLRRVCRDRQLRRPGRNGARGLRGPGGAVDGPARKRLGAVLRSAREGRI